MPDVPGGQGRDTCPGPGWWLASDNKWYPPETSPENRTKKAAKKKVTKKKVAKKKPAAKAQPPAAAPAPTASDDHYPEELEELTAPPPATEQIAARRMQAREQTVLLADDRRLAAMRALSSLDISDEQVLVGVGGRSIDARSGSTAAPPAPVSPPEEAPVVEPEVTEPEVSEPAAASPPAPAPPVDDRADDPGSAPAAVPSGGFGAGFAQHQPVGPQPAPAGMGLDVPFMEVRGSALGTDIDKIGEKILIFGDRVELLDRGNLVRLAIPYDQLAGVTITKKMMGPTLEIRATTGRSMSAKSLRPETASGAKAMIEKHAARFREEGGVAAAAPPEAEPDVEELPEVEAEAEPLADYAAPAPLAEPELALVEPIPAPEPEPLVDAEPAVDEAAPEPEAIEAPADEVRLEDLSVDEAPEARATASADLDGPAEPVVAAAPAPVKPRVSQAVLIGMLEELTDAGVLTEEEQAEKLALLEKLYL